MASATITVNSNGTISGPSPMPGWLKVNDPSASDIEITQNGNTTLTFTAASSTFDSFAWSTSTSNVSYTSVSSTQFTISDNVNGSLDPAGGFTVNIGTQSVDPTIVNNPG